MGGGYGFLDSYVEPELAHASSRATVVLNLAIGYLENLTPIPEENRFIQADSRSPDVNSPRLAARRARIGD